MKLKLFCAIEGADGVGKTTTLKLAHTMSNGKFKLFKTPTEEIAQVRHVFDAPEVPVSARFFFYLAATIHASRQITALLEDDPIVCDRYILSTIAYHNILTKRVVDFTHLIYEFEELGGKIPDIVVILIAEEAERLKRVMKRNTGTNTHMDYDMQFTTLVQNEFLRLADLLSKKSLIELVDTSKIDESEVARKLLQIMEKYQRV